MDKGLAPGFTRISYTGASGGHHAQVPVNLVDGWVQGEEPSLTTKGGTAVAAITAITAFEEKWRDLLTTDQRIGLCEIYAVNAETGEGEFVFGFDFADVGSRVGDSILYRGLSITLKLTNGRTGKVVILENDYPADLNDAAPFTAGLPERILADWLSSDDSIYYGRGNAYPFAAMRMETKEYDVLRKRGGF